MSLNLVTSPESSVNKSLKEISSCILKIKLSFFKLAPKLELKNGFWTDFQKMLLKTTKPRMGTETNPAFPLVLA